MGHIFELGDKYSKAMKANILNEQGKSQSILMGCYGIGVSRVVAAAIEQFYDNKGIVWPNCLAPFQSTIIGLQYHKSKRRSIY